MKIEDKIVSYEIAGQLSKTTDNKAGKVGEKQPAETQDSEGKGPSGQDDVKLSDSSKEAQLIREVISSQPEIREDKVAELKARIDSGQYKIDHDAVAGKMVDEFIDELL